MKTCQQCKKIFTVTKNDEKFYDMMDLPEPTQCPYCRMIRRLAFRNERNLYHRKCDLTGGKIISAYSSDKNFPVYGVDSWWSDDWDALDYGQNFDFHRPFFEQFHELLMEVPRISLVQQKPLINSDYCNCASNNKNCYLLFSTNFNEDSYYGSWVNHCKDSMDGLGILRCEQCYECVDCVDCHRVFFSQDSKNCSDSFFLKSCQSVRNSLFCVNLVNKKYCIFNKQYSKEKYEKILSETKLYSSKTIEILKKKFYEFCITQPTREYFGTQNENSVGNLINECQRCYHCFEVSNGQDLSYCYNVSHVKDSMDYSYWGENAERMYECQANGYNMYNCRFTDLCWDSCSDLTYCSQCFSSQNCFGCIGLKKKKYCIFNKQYSKEEYENLLLKIIDHMKKTEEWGEFFPIKNSQYCYNETLAFEQQPLSKEEVLKMGWSWKDREELYAYPESQVKIPDSILDSNISLCDQVFVCENSGRKFKIIPQEFNNLKRWGLPLPRKHPDERHLDRLKKRNPRRFWDRMCYKCSKSIRTTYSSDRPEKIYCEECYSQEVFVVPFQPCT